MNNAQCATADTELFYLDKGGQPELAERICAHCTVRSECLDYALRHNERHGMWGGMSENARAKLRAASDTRAERLRRRHEQRMAYIVGTAEPPEEPQVCPEGHALTEDNRWRNGTDPSGRQRYICRTCSSAARKTG